MTAAKTDAGVVSLPGAQGAAAAKAAGRGHRRAGRRPAGQGALPQPGGTCGWRRARCSPGLDRPSRPSTAPPAGSTACCRRCCPPAPTMCTALWTGPGRSTCPGGEAHDSEISLEGWASSAAAHPRHLRPGRGRKPKCGWISPPPCSEMFPPGAGGTASSAGPGRRGCCRCAATSCGTFPPTPRGPWDDTVFGGGARGMLLAAEPFAPGHRPAAGTFGLAAAYSAI